MKDEHKLMIQILMSRGLVGERELKDIYKTIQQRCEVRDSPTLNEFKNLINKKLREVSMEIRQKPDEDTGEQKYALVQTMESDLGKLTTDYLPQQLELFKKTVGLIMDSPEGMASSTDILNLKLERLTKQDAQETLNKFVKEQWLNQDEGYVWMTGRSIMELEMYLRKTYQPDKCSHCKDMVIKGQVCTQCEIKLHGYCLDRLFTDRRRVCPNCSQHWS
ncbi:non-structural maintenance of chromosomes element 1 homolog [Lytechinus variegatus]|uniref:non-structural maintenance of chromosomes element 1 homolog n=1 Tax=Lytechinus variegatus TaxID=7654 RepID=UPI001BB18886|nr:non-structural maintenance of chromosomes element 1 homolog [Lytechinus variegatus]